MDSDDFFEQLDINRHKCLFQNNFIDESPEDAFMDFVQERINGDDPIDKQNNRSTDAVDKTIQAPRQNYIDLESHHIHSQQDKKMKSEEDKNPKIVFSQQARQKRKKIMKGQLRESDHLGLYFRIITMPILRMIVSAKLIDSEQIIKIRNFKKQSGSIENFKELFKNQDIRQFCQKYFSSNFIVKDILTHKRMQLKNKMMLLKYIKSLRQISYIPIKQWKPKIQE